METRIRLIRFQEANPATIDFMYPAPRTLSRLNALFATGNYEVKVELVPANGEPPVEYVTTVRSPSLNAPVAITFDRGPLSVSVARVSIRHMDYNDVAKIHVRDLLLR